MTEETLQKLKLMLCYNQIRLSDIPQIARIRNQQLYIAAFLGNISSKKRYLEDLQLMKRDLSIVKNQYDSLVKCYNNMKYWIIRCWDYNNEKENSETIYTKTGGKSD